MNMLAVKAGAVAVVVGVWSAPASEAQISVPLPPSQKSETTFSIGGGGELAVRRTVTYVRFRKGFLPVRNESEAEYFWNQRGPRSLTAASIIAGADFLATSVELASDVGGPIRWGIAANIASARNSEATPAKTDSADTQQETLSRLLQDGGLLAGNAVYPLWYTQSGADTALRLTSGLVLRASFGWDSPKADSLLKKPGIAGSVGLEWSLAATTKKGILGGEIGLQERLYWYNASYQARLQLSRRNAGVLSLRVGIIALRKTRLGLYVPLSKTKGIDSIVSNAAYVQQVISL